MSGSELPLSSIEEGESAFYIRLETTDTPGVIGNLGHALGGHNVSLHSLVQRGITKDGTATIIFLTHRASERSVSGALKEIEAQATTKQIGVALRVFD